MKNRSDGELGRGRKQLLDNVKETGGCCKLKTKHETALYGELALVEAVDRS